MESNDVNAIPLSGSSQRDAKSESESEVLPNDCVFIAGAGPVGMLVATTLAFYGVKSILMERNHTTTK